MVRGLNRFYLPDIAEQTIEEKLQLVAGMTNFVLCEGSEPSGHIDELKICAFNRIVTAVLRKKTHGATWMQSDYEIDMKFIKEFVYDDSIYDVLPSVKRWAERAVKQRRMFLEAKYPWRAAL